MSYIYINELNVGDYFIEDTFIEVWLVIETNVKVHQMIGIKAEVVGSVTAKYSRMNERSEWAGDHQSLIKVEKKNGMFVPCEGTPRGDD